MNPKYTKIYGTVLKIGIVIVLALQDIKVVEGM